MAPVASTAISGHAGNAFTASDSNAAVFGNISQTDAANLAALLEPGHSPQTAALVRNLLEDTAAAVAQGDSTRAIANVTEIVRLDPSRMETVRVDPALGPIRPEMERVLHQLTSTARIDAEGSIGRAAQLLESAGETRFSNWQTRPETLIEVAHRLFDAGGYANYVRSAELTQLIVDYSPWIVNYATARPARIPGEDVNAQRALEAGIRKNWSAIRKRAESELRILWVRAPLLVLLLGWLAFGLVGGPLALLLRSLWPHAWPGALIDACYNLWAIGFLALVGFGFYARVRRIRF